MLDTYDIIVIGSGPGGYPAAIRASTREKKVALIEAGQLGGTCLNVGCIPSKTLISSAEKFASLSQMQDFGIHIEKATFDYAKMVERKDKVVSQIRKNLEALLVSHGVDIIRGFASFLSKNEVKVTGDKERTLKAQKIIIACGSEPRQIPAFPFDQKQILDSTALLNLKTLPKSMVIVGGGVIGCEFASLYNLLGVKITLIEMLPSLLPMECPSVSSFITRHFKKQGIEVETGAKVEKIEKEERQVQVKLGNGKSYAGEIALVAVGRKMCFDGLNLDKIGIKIKEGVQIVVDEKMETSVPGIYAVGDIASKYWLAHVATHQGLVAADNASGYPALMHYNAVPNVIFTHPEIATVGYSQEEAKRLGHDVSIGQFPFQALGKAQAGGETEGFSQIVIDKKTGAVLGAQIVGNHASSLIGEAATAIQNELVVESLQETIHPHPTLTEGLMEASFLAVDMPLHLPPKKR